MKKFIVIPLLILLLSGCESDNIDSNQIEEQTFENFNVTSDLLQKHSNLDEILDFLKVNSLEEVVIQKYYFDGSLDYSEHRVPKRYVSIEKKMNGYSLIGEEERYAIAEFHGDINQLSLVSTIVKDNKNQCIKITQYNSETKKSGEFNFYYSLENESSEYNALEFEKGDCWHWCMHDELQAIQDGNWIKKLAFIAGIPGSVLYLYASCAWDCMTD